MSQAPEDPEALDGDEDVDEAQGDLEGDSEGQGDEGDASDEALAGGLTGKQRRYLRSLGHHLDPLVQLGKSGVTDGVIAAISRVLETHELVKVRVGTECPVSTKEAARAVAPRVLAALAQTLGKTFLVYRRHPKKPTIVLPR